MNRSPPLVPQPGNAAGSGGSTLPKPAPYADSLRTEFRNFIILLLSERALRHPSPSLPGKRAVPQPVPPEHWCEQPPLAEPALPLPTPASRAPLGAEQLLFFPACAFSSEAGWWLAAQVLLVVCLAAP